MGSLRSCRSALMLSQKEIYSKKKKIQSDWKGGKMRTFHQILKDKYLMSDVSVRKGLMGNPSSSAV